MRPVTIYTTPLCAYCTVARRLLADKGIAFEEIDIFAEPERRAEMIERSRGALTVPQIFVGGEHIGGLGEIFELDQSGRLDPILSQG